MIKYYMNIQGIVFTEADAIDYYGNRFNSAVLCEVFHNGFDEDGQSIFSSAK